MKATTLNSALAAIAAVAALHVGMMPTLSPRPGQVHYRRGGMFLIMRLLVCSTDDFLVEGEVDARGNAIYPTSKTTSCTESATTAQGVAASPSYNEMPGMMHSSSSTVWGVASSESSLPLRGKASKCCGRQNFLSPSSLFLLPSTSLLLIRF